MSSLLAVVVIVNPPAPAVLAFAADAPFTVQDIATVLGAIIGSSIGSEIAANKKEGIELLVKTDAGNFISIIQEVGAYSFYKGQSIRIIKRNGKSRVVPFD